MSELSKILLAEIYSGQPKKSPLRENGNTAFELSYWLNELSDQGNEVILSETTKKGENIIIYRQSSGEDESRIILRSRIFSEEGNSSLTPSMFLTYKEKYEILEIADIHMEEPDADKGYGSAFMRSMFLLIERYQYSIKYITGWISRTDWDHIDRNQYFYEKFGFTVSLNNKIQEGNILWINPANSGSLADYQSLNTKPGIAGLLQDFSIQQNDE